MRVACGAPAGFDRVYARGAQKEVAQRFRKVGDERPVNGMRWRPPVVEVQMRERLEEEPERVLVKGKARRQQLDPPTRRKRAWKCPKQRRARRCLKRGRRCWRSLTSYAMGYIVHLAGHANSWVRLLSAARSASVTLASRSSRRCRDT